MGKTYRVLNDKNADRFVCFDEGNYTFPALGDIPNKLKYTTHFANLYEAIRTNNDNALLDILTHNIQCSTVKATQGHWNFNDTYHVPSEYYLYTRPFIEWLFIEKPDEFNHLIESILVPQDYRNSLCGAVVKSLVDTDLGNPSLLQLSTQLQLLIKENIQKLKNHAASLAEKEDEGAIQRSLVIDKLASELDSQLDSMICELGNHGIYTEKMLILNFKLKFIVTLHSKDKNDNQNHRLGLNKHRDGGLAIITSNLASALFTGGIANLILGISTKGSHWVFFKDTDTQNHITKLENTLGLPPIFTSKLRING